MTDRLWHRLLPLALAFPALVSPASAQDEPLRVFLRAGAKTHGEGEHDHPRFLEEWSELLRGRGARVDGALAFPSADQLARTDVLVMYAADAGSIHGDERERFEAYLDGGGGIVALHDAVCGDDPHWYKTVIGGAWEHGHSKWHTGKIGLYFTADDHPITRGVANFDFDDEIYHELHLAPETRVLANGFHTPFDVTPQMWTYEKDDYRAFVSVQGHYRRSFEHGAWRTLLLRGIAWAGKRDPELLLADGESEALRYPEGGPRRPDVASEPLQAHADFDVELVAAEPLVINPISLDWDPRGRMWVATTPGYPYKEESSGIPAHDRILILEDSDGDGRMDGRKVFHEGLDLVTSLVFHRDGVIVTAAPDILWLRDTDGDDVADETRTLYTGFGYGDTHAVISNMRWGMDGWIYATQGYSGNASQHVTGTEDFGRIPNGLFRFRPDGSAIETVVSYGSNTWGLDFTWDGELFFTMANGSHLRHVVMPDSSLRAGRIGGVSSWVDVTDHQKAFPVSTVERPPYAQIDFVGGFTGAAGGLIYGGGAWPGQFEGNHFVAEPTINLVHRDVLTSRGSTFKAHKPREAEFLASTDLWFRPVHMRVGPDGAMYVLDFCNQAAVHNDTRGPEHGPTNAAVRPDRDRLHGRIWRVQHRQVRELPTVRLHDVSVHQLVTALEHPNRWQRMSAQRLLCEPDGGAGDAGTALAGFLLANRTEYAYAKVHALWAMERLGVSNDQLLVAALRDADPGVRKNAVLILGEQDRPRLYNQLLVVLGDRDRRVRLAAIRVLGDDPYRNASPKQLLALYPRLRDDWSRSAVLNAAARVPVLFLEKAFARPDQDALLDLIGELTALAVRAPDGAGEPGLDDLFFALGNAERASPETLVAVLTRVERELKGDADPPDPRVLMPLLRRLLRSAELEVAVAAMPFAARWDSDGGLERAVEALAPRLVREVRDTEQEDSVRLLCLNTLLAMPRHRAEGIAAAARLLDVYLPLEVQLEVIEGLARTVDDEAADVLIRAYPALGGRAREAAFGRLVERPAWAARLLGAVEAEEIRPNDLGPHRVHRLRHHADTVVASRADLVFDRLLGAKTQAMDELIASLLPVIEQPGDLANGKALYQKNCGNCHTYQGAGAEVGPDLTGMGAHGARELLPFILDPNLSVEAAYLEYVVKTIDGKTFGGVLVREDDRSVVLRSTEGDFEVLRDDILDLSSSGRSPMPTGFEDLGGEALRDILAYLTADVAGVRIVDLRPFVSSTTRALYDERDGAGPMRLVRYGIVDVEGVPFEIIDPDRVVGGANVLVLKGGMRDDWISKTKMPQRVEVPIGMPVARLHVLGGIAAWGFPFTQSRDPIVKWTWNYADGGTETRVLNDGDQFADWIGRREVPGSRFVPLVEQGSRGQVRTFSLVPERDAVVETIVLESFDNHLAPTFLAMTVQLPGFEIAPPAPEPVAVPASTRFLIVGGGSSHDYGRWFRDQGLATLSTFGPGVVEYTERPADVLPRLPQLDLLYLSNNQPLPDAELRAGIFDLVARGGGLLLVHAATWYNWQDWPEYNAQLVGGGAESHEAYGEFEVIVLNGDHPVTKALPESFRIKDELYRFEANPSAEVEVLAVGRSLTTGAHYPVVWTARHGTGRIVCTTLGHDGAAHTHIAFQRLLRQSCEWLRSDD